SEAREPEEAREDVEPAHCEEIHLGEQATHRTNVCYARSTSRGGLDGRPYGIAEERSRARDRGRIAGRSRILRVGRIFAEPDASSHKGIPRDEGLLGGQGRRRQLLHDQVLERQGTPGWHEDLLS